MGRPYNKNRIYFLKKKSMENTATKVFIENREIPWEPTAPGMKRKIMAYDDRVMLVKVAFEKGGIGSLHSHPHTQISHVESGVFEVEISGEKKLLSAGDAFYVPPHAVHGAVCMEAGVLIDIFSPMREDFLQTQD
jgi:quercetin dioxygenase-like cupin family protein